MCTNTFQKQIIDCIGSYIKWNVYTENCMLFYLDTQVSFKQNACLLLNNNTQIFQSEMTIKHMDTQRFFNITFSGIKI